ncbi:GDP-mannose 4,6-dehydratase [Salmonella enterica subsp. enterica]
MRRFLTTLMILLVVLVAGFSALVLLVNPNDFRAYMVQQVAARSEYQLQLDGPLRWHVWPQLSILSGRMTLTARGASEPLVRADNMRLDVALWPLLSHQLHVKQVMLKGGVIQLTPQTEAVRSDDAPGVKPGDVIVAVDPRYFRPAEVETLLGDPSKAHEKLGWKPEITLSEMVSEMVANDLEAAKKHSLLKSHGYEVAIALES